MELWLNLLFGNPVGLASMIVIFATIAIVCYILYMLYDKSKPKN
ncbi:MAG: DUF3149 domain-containing protein [Gammaproteobacteria bacterium]